MDLKVAKAVALLEVINRECNVKTVDDKARPVEKEPIQSDIEETSDKSSNSETMHLVIHASRPDQKDFPTCCCYPDFCQSLIRNRPAVNSAGRPKPTERFGHPAVWSKRPAPVSAGRPVSAGWLNPAARPYFRPSSVYFNNMYWPNLYDPMYMNKGDGGSVLRPQQDQFQVRNGLENMYTGKQGESLMILWLVKGGIVKFRGGDGKISGKGTIKTSKLDFENVYYVVLRIPRERDLYTFNISELQPEQNVTCLVAKASSDESTRWHRRMAHVNFKTINKLAKEGGGEEEG
ncbi:ribonuclease H-like domain-containing protein [Tanacetum coccineum]